MYEFDKEDYKSLKAALKQEGVKLLVLPYAGPNGCVVAYRKRTGLKMIEVSVSYCSVDDKFKKRKGKYQAMIKFITSESIQLPLGHLSDEELEVALDYMFAL